MRDIQSVLSRIDNAIAQEPENPRWLIQKLQCLLALQEKAQANQIAQQVLALPQLENGLCADFALALNALQRYQEALQYYQFALSRAHDKTTKSQLLFNMGSIYRYLGEVEKANNLLDAALELQPEDAEAQLLRSSLKKQTEESNHIEELTHLFADADNTPIQKATFAYALAKELEDLQRYEQSFEVLYSGAESRRKNMQYQVQHDLDTITDIIAGFNQEFVANSEGKGSANQEPIFILGLPRTGSTLIERILSQHSDVYAAGELNDFALSMMAQVKAEVSTPPRNKSELVAATRQLDFAALGERYIQATRSDTGHTKRFIDKLPLNSLNIGLIQAALPKAKIIHVKRNPMDTCYAIYKQLFTQGYPFSYDLNELAEYYIAHEKLMAHWLDLYPNGIHQIEYEKVVDDIENEARQLLEFCELPWQPECIDFEQNAQPSTTASASQVRQKLYASSVGKWRNYEAQLAPLKHKLEQAGIQCD